MRSLADATARRAAIRAKAATADQRLDRLTKPDLRSKPRTAARCESPQLRRRASYSWTNRDSNGHPLGQRLWQRHKPHGNVSRSYEAGTTSFKQQIVRSENSVFESSQNPGRRLDAAVLSRSTRRIRRLHFAGRPLICQCRSSPPSARRLVNDSVEFREAATSKAKT